MVYGEAVVACGMPEPCKCLSLDSCQKKVPWTHKEVCLAPHPVVSLVFQVGDTEKFPQALCFKNFETSFISQQAGSMLHIYEI